MTRGKAPGDYEPVGKTHYIGDVRAGAPKTAYSDEHELVYPISAEYDEETNTTTVEWGKRKES